MTTNILAIGCKLSELGDASVIRINSREEAEARWGKNSLLAEMAFPKPRAPHPEPEPEQYGPADIAAIDKSNGADRVIYAVLTRGWYDDRHDYCDTEGLYTTLQRAKNEAGYVDGWVEVWEVKE